MNTLSKQAAFIYSTVYLASIYWVSAVCKAVEKNTLKALRSLPQELTVQGSASRLAEPTGAW